ncbi:N-formylglutamate amidohydrolase [Carboxylicivirga linearis]|uniref:N-formylglutamate amidohydrolase n=1 Tax=Carboxylicivirga linearis TaxID=1628157 RepID=A0ABS5JRC3_9BACT|nr:N-formylglutamate amidohydrolase [Carboxylicivirga linearis]MBS2097443.1 N-formylglutamate amidohydrolase [Carboxylicivirga linearis]
MKVVLSCEHAVNTVPEKYKFLFQGAEKILQTHRGYDLGALELFKMLQNSDIAFSQFATVSRLLIDINRSPYRRTLFSEFTKPLNQSAKDEILEEYYYGFRRLFEEKIYQFWKQNHTVLHLSIHSFAPELNGEIRQTDFGILYHPGRQQEKQFAKIWKQELVKLLPEFCVRFNYPYRGKPDGHVRYFRDREEEKYLGLEFEMNQKYAENSQVHKKIAKAFGSSVEIINKT